MGIDEDIAASEQLIGKIVAGHDLNNKSPDEMRGILREYSGTNPRDMSQEDRVALSILRVRLGDYDAGKYSKGDNGDMDQDDAGEGMFY